MPGYVIHLAVAKEYLKKSKNRNENEELYKNGLFSVLDLCNVYSVY